MICGCTSTQTTAARLQLNDARLRAVSTPVRVRAGETSSTVTVSSVSNLGGTAAVAAVLRNSGDHPVSDLPISVGYVLRGKTHFINTVTSSYWNNHVPSIAAHGSLTWVGDISANTFPMHSKLFVRVGAKPSISVGTVTTPDISVTLGAAKSGSVVVPARLTNESSIPQYQVPVYTLVTHAGRIVGARVLSLATLAGHAKVRINLALSNSGQSGAGYSIHVEAPATIFK